MPTKNTRTKKVKKANRENTRQPTLTAGSDELALREEGGPLELSGPELHVYGGSSSICITDNRGYATPRNRSPLEIRLDASEGFIPLWQHGANLRWRFNENSMRNFQRPEAAKAALRILIGEALMAWGDSCPIRFTEQTDVWDFEIVMQRTDRCSGGGCTLASAFLPDAGRHALTIYPKMFSQSRKEQIDTLIHEFGHVFGLRHFFANVSETAWPSEVFGTNRPFSIMNYGQNSELTDYDKADLKSLYEQAWSGRLRTINGTPISLVSPYHYLAPQENSKH